MAVRVDVCVYVCDWQHKYVWKTLLDTVKAKTYILSWGACETLLPNISFPAFISL